MHATLPLPTSDVDLFADDVLHDPYPALREAGPAVRLTTYDAWLLPRYDHVRVALSDHERFSSAHGVGYEDQFNAQMKGTVLVSDPPDQTRLRALLSDKLAPKALAGLRTRITVIADDLVADADTRLPHPAIARHLPGLRNRQPELQDTLCNLVDGHKSRTGSSATRWRPAL